MKETPLDQNTTRRAFLGTACKFAPLIALGMGLTGCDSGSGMDDDTGGSNNGNNNNNNTNTGVTVSGDTITLDLTGSSAKRVASAGGFLFISAARTVVLNDGGTIRAFTSVCTHQQCDVTTFSSGRMTCPCHGSQFSTSGQAVRGPATAALREYGVAQNGDIVTVTKR